MVQAAAPAMIAGMNHPLFNTTHPCEAPRPVSGDGRSAAKGPRMRTHDRQRENLVPLRSANVFPTGGQRPQVPRASARVMNINGKFGRPPTTSA
jgi:hypothetical protein